MVGRLRAVCTWLRTTVGSRAYIDDDVLVERTGRRVVRLPLREVRHVTSDWIPYRGRVLQVSGGGTRITVDVDQTTLDLRHQVGRRVIQNGPSVVESSAVKRDLGVDSTRTRGLPD
jgi:hypothetical protein